MGPAGAEGGVGPQGEVGPPGPALEGFLYAADASEPRFTTPGVFPFLFKIEPQVELGVAVEDNPAEVFTVEHGGVYRIEFSVRFVGGPEPTSLAAIAVEVNGVGVDGALVNVPAGSYADREVLVELDEGDEVSLRFLPNGVVDGDWDFIDPSLVIQRIHPGS